MNRMAFKDRTIQKHREASKLSYHDKNKKKKHTLSISKLQNKVENKQKTSWSNFLDALAKVKVFKSTYESIHSKINNKFKVKIINQQQNSLPLKKNDKEIPQINKEYVPSLDNNRSEKLREALLRKEQLMEKLKKIDSKLNNVKKVEAIKLYQNSEMSISGLSREKLSTFRNHNYTNSPLKAKQQIAYSVQNHSKAVQMLNKVNNQKLRRQQKLMQQIKKKQQQQLKQLARLESAKLAQLQQKEKKRDEFLLKRSKLKLTSNQRSFQTRNKQNKHSQIPAQMALSKQLQEDASTKNKKESQNMHLINAQKFKLPQIPKFISEQDFFSKKQRSGKIQEHYQTSEQIYQQVNKQQEKNTQNKDVIANTQQLQIQRQMQMNDFEQYQNERRQDKKQAGKVQQDQHNEEKYIQSSNLILPTTIDQKPQRQKEDEYENIVNEINQHNLRDQIYQDQKDLENQKVFASNNREDLEEEQGKQIN